MTENRLKNKASKRDLEFSRKTHPRHNISVIIAKDVDHQLDRHVVVEQAQIRYFHQFRTKHCQYSIYGADQCTDRCHKYHSVFRSVYRCDRSTGHKWLLTPPSPVLPLLGAFHSFHSLYLIAYLLSPLVNKVERNIFVPLFRKVVRKKRAVRGISRAVSVAVVLILPQISAYLFGESLSV